MGAEISAWMWMVLASTCIVGLVAGAVIGVALAPSGRRAIELSNELKALRAKHEAYRDDVTQHFAKTGELVNAMTRSYKTVYDHLASGAHNLSDAELVTTKLPFYNEKVPVLTMAEKDSEAAEAAGKSSSLDTPDEMSSSVESSPVVTAGPDLERGDVKPSAPKDYALRPTPEVSSTEQGAVT